MLNHLLSKVADSLLEHRVGRGTVVGCLLRLVKVLDKTIVDRRESVLVLNLLDHGRQGLDTCVPHFGHIFIFLVFLALQDEAGVVKDLEEGFQHRLGVEKAQVLVALLEELAQDEGVLEVGLVLRLVPDEAFKRVDGGLLFGQVVLREAGPELVTL